MASQIVAFLSTKMDNSRRGKTVNSRRDKEHIPHYSTRVINLEEDFALTFKLGSDRFGFGFLVISVYFCQLRIKYHVIRTLAETCYGYLECQNKIVKGIQSFEKARDDMR